MKFIADNSEIPSIHRTTFETLSNKTKNAIRNEHDDGNRREHRLQNTLQLIIFFGYPLGQTQTMN